MVVDRVVDGWATVTVTGSLFDWYMIYDDGKNLVSYGSLEGTSRTIEFRVVPGTLSTYQLQLAKSADPVFFEVDAR